MSGFKGLIQRPKFYEYFERRLDASSNDCSHKGCDLPATHIGGFYRVDNRRVRVWYCLNHLVGNPLRELPVPPDIQAGIDADLAYIRAMEKRYENETLDRSESIKFLAPSGHGEPIKTDRIAAWRWGA